MKATLPEPEIGALNMRRMFERADKVDYREGLLAYARYHKVMQDLASLYDVPLDRVVAAFASLSPNNDYMGNLRSLVSLLKGVREGVPLPRITVSTYRHCLVRAHKHVTAPTNTFTLETSGPKILNFYYNVLFPDNPRWVTIDGHMVATYVGDEQMIMKDALVSRKQYNEVARVVKALAFSEFILPNHYQAIVWFVRKRVCRVKYNPQGDLFAAADADLWRTYHDVRTVKPFPLGMSKS